jgi:hypothetical protein
VENLIDWDNLMNVDPFLRPLARRSFRVGKALRGADGAVIP